MQPLRFTACLSVCFALLTLVFLLSGMPGYAVKKPISAGVKTTAAPPLNAGVVAEEPNEKPPGTLGPWQKIDLSHSGFYYQTDFSTRYLRLKANWQQQHPGEVPQLYQLHELSIQANGLCTTPLRELDFWRLQGGPNPWFITPAIHIKNGSKTEALLDVYLDTKIEMAMGQLYVNPDTLLVDYPNLEKSAVWETIGTRTEVIQAVAPEEEALVPLSPVDVLGELEESLRKRKDHWPYELRITVSVRPPASAKAGGKIPRQSATLKLLPDHFALPVTMY